ncbi:helix-turn-helix domain-containing protein [Buttiauxella sp.]|uniref:winged helix-turn-helix transcriptional regulator n=1 Tax=Buttiauxella sp. TaxID=1972222 RepID=UPI003C790293
MKDSSAQDFPTFIYSQATFDLIDLLSPHVTFETIPAGRRLYYCVNGENMCYVILSGTIKVGRDIDSFVVSSMPVPNIAGISNLLPETTGLYIETLKESEIATLTTAYAQQLIGETNSWQLLVNHIAKVTANLFHNNIIMTAPSTYEVLRFQLMALMNEPDSVRESTSAVKYVLERTRLSRSTVMKMLAQLKQGGYIQLDDGILIKLNSLPAKY